MVAKRSRRRRTTAGKGNSHDTRAELQKIILDVNDALFEALPSLPQGQPRTQALSSTLLAGENTLAGAGHVYPKFWVAKSIIAVGGLVEESVCRVWKIATLCFIVSGDKHALYNKKS